MEVVDFLKTEKELYLQRFPWNEWVFEGEEEEMAESGYNSLKCEVYLDGVDLELDDKNDEDDNFDDDGMKTMEMV